MAEPMLQRAMPVLLVLLLALLLACVAASPAASAAADAAAAGAGPVSAACEFATLHVHAISHEHDDASSAAATESAEVPDTTHFHVVHMHTFWNQPVYIRRRNESAEEDSADDEERVMSLSSHHALSASEDASVLSEVFDVCCAGRCSAPHLAHPPALSAALPMHAHHVASPLHPSLEGSDSDASLDHWINPRNVLRRQWVPSSLLAPPPNEIGFVFVARMDEAAWEQHAARMDEPAAHKVQCSVRINEAKAREMGVTLTNMQGTPLDFQPLQMTCDAAGSRGPASDAQADDAAWSEHDGAIDFSAAHDQQHDEIDIFVDIESVRAGEMEQHEAAAAAKRTSAAEAETASAIATAEQAAAGAVDKTVMHLYYERQLSLHHARHAAESNSDASPAPKLDGSDGFDPWFDPHYLSDESDLVPHLIFESRPDLFSGSLPSIVHHHSRGYFVDPHHLPVHPSGERRMLVEVQVQGQVDRMGRNKTKLMRLPFLHPDEHHFNSGEHEHEEEPDAHLFVLHHELLTVDSDEMPSHSSPHPLVEVALDRSPLLDGSNWPAHMQRDMLAFLEFGVDLEAASASSSFIASEDPTPILSPAQRELSDYLSSTIGFDAVGSPVKIDGVMPLVDSPLSPLKLLRPECLQEEMDSALREAREQWLDRMDAHKAIVDAKRLANVRQRMAAGGRPQGKLPIVLPSPLVRRRLSPMAGVVVTPSLLADALKDRSIGQPPPTYTPPVIVLPQPAPPKEPHWKKQQREDEAKEKAAKAKKKKGKKATGKKKGGGKGGKKGGGKKAAGKGGKKGSGSGSGSGKKANKKSSKKSAGKGKKRRFLQLHMESESAAEVGSASASASASGVRVDGSDTINEVDREPHQVDEVINDYEDCDLEAPFKNPTCPLPTFLHILPNLLIKIAVCVLIPPVLDEFAEEYMKGQGPSLKIWNNLLLQVDEKVTRGLSEDSLEAFTATPPTVKPRLGSAGRAPTPFDRERAYNTMADHIAAHYFNDFMAESREKVERNLPDQSFHRAAARAAANVDSGILLDPQRKPLAMVFHEEFTRLLEQNGLVHQDLMSSAATSAATATDAAGMDTSQSPRAAGGEGGGTEYGDIMRGKKLVVTIKGGLFSALQKPIVQNLAKQVTVGVTGQVVPAVYDALTDILRDELPDAVRHSVMHTTGNAAGLAVSVTVAESVERLLPLVPIRQLTQGLTHMLTRSVSHALSSVLLHSLGSTPLRDYYCYYCMYYSYGCTQCHEHNRSSMRYAQTYGYFYASYFGDYYSDHYAEQIYAIMGKDRSA